MKRCGRLNELFVKKWIWQYKIYTYIFYMNTTQKTADFYRERQEQLNSLYSDRVREWLKYFDLDTKYKDKLVHIITWPTSSLPGREWKTSNRARLLGIGAIVRFSIGGIVGECPSFKPSSLKRKLLPSKWKVLRLFTSDDTESNITDTLTEENN